MQPSIIPVLIDERDALIPDAPRPSQITDLSSAFGLAEVEAEARRLVSYFAERADNRWVPFTFAELLDHYRTHAWNSQGMLYGLLGTYQHISAMGYLNWYRPDPYVVHTGAKLVITKAFLERVSKNTTKPLAADVS